MARRGAAQYANGPAGPRPDRLSAARRRGSPRLVYLFVDMSQINYVRVIDSKYIQERGRAATGNGDKSERHRYERAARGSALPLAVRHRIGYSFCARGGSVPSAISAAVHIRRTGRDARSDSPDRTRAATSAYSQHAQARRVAAQLARQRGQARAVGAQRVQAARARQRRQRRQPARVRQDPATRRASAHALAPARRPATGRESPAGRFRPLPELSSA